MKNLITEQDRQKFMTCYEKLINLNIEALLPEAIAENGDICPDLISKLASHDTAERFFKLAMMLTDYNSHTNLTAITDIEGVILRHFIDSLVAEPYIPEGARLIDVGTGAGFPSLPLAIVRDDLSITALDSTAKKLDFVDSAAVSLGLSGVSVLAGRAEELSAVNPGNLRETYDVAIARAVAPLNILSELCLPFVKVGGMFIALKGSGAQKELSEARNAISRLGGKLENAFQTDIFATINGYFENRYVCIIRKVSPTPAKLPRQFAAIKSSPL